MARNRSTIAILAALGLAAALALGSSSTPNPLIPPGSPTYDVDYRDKAAEVKYPADAGNAGGKVKRTYKPPRDMSQITGITIHHVGVAAVGDGAVHKFTYHVVVHDDGKVYWLHPFETYLLHGHSLNKDTIAISVSGAFGKSSIELSPEQAAGLRRAIAWVTQAANAQGADIREIWTHRQSSKDRGLDPGRSPYREGVMWAQNTLGLAHDPNQTRGGLVIPEIWLSETVSLEDEPDVTMLAEADHELNHVAALPHELIESMFRATA
jgi:hypothetical protein